jgi:pimeloyl-ACP methyl ester carboxylesterase
MMIPAGYPEGPAPSRAASRRTARLLAGGPPASLLLVHGAGSGPWIFRGWARAFPGINVAYVDLQAGVEVAGATHDDYAGKATRAARALPQPVSLCGWSMGGLVALQASQRVRPHSLLLLEPSPPAEVQGLNPAVEASNGTFDPEETYGRFPPGMRSRPESSRARAERKQGISVPSVPCPSLVVYGDEYRERRGTQIARLYNSQELYFPGVNHWGLIRSPAVRAALAHRLCQATPHE